MAACLRVLVALALISQFALADDTVSVSGEYDTTYGLMKLSQTGEKVKGTYGSVTRQINSLEGTLKAPKLTFTYTETNAAGEGWYEFAADGQSFAGQWKENGSEVWLEWTGKRRAVKVLDDPNSFTGLWHTQYGKMRLKQTGKDVAGIYAYAGRSNLKGTVEGRTLKFTYDQPDGEKGEGSYELAADGKSWKGSYKDAAGKQGKWDAKRVSATPGHVWLIILEAPWEHRLEENEYSYGQMLRTFFQRVPQVNIRHKFFNSGEDLKKWTAEVPFLAEPVYLYISSHGTEKGVGVGKEQIGAKALAELVKDAGDLRLLHFGTCLVLRGDIPKEIHKILGDQATFPISGFNQSADWAGSAVIDMLYLDLMFARGLSPGDAVKQVRKTITFAGEKFNPGDKVAPCGLVIFEPPKSVSP